jgi:SAM-dependent methyltransferase
MLPYALTIFTSAFLLFQVQPLIGKYILPWFGGSTGVWTTCMLFFQIVLLGGYAYAHLSAKFLKARQQAILHLVLLAVALAVSFPSITPGDAWKPKGAEDPILKILLLLTVNLGLPYFVLSSTGPLMQQWLSQTNPGVSPYRLYALSNVGSLLALVSYPFFFEVKFTRKDQAMMWGLGLVLFVLFCGWCAVRLLRSSEQVRPKSEADAEPVPVPGRFTKFLWLALAGCASVLLLATTNKMCQDIASNPFLWVLPLGLYLLSFIICFDSPRWYRRGVFSLALVITASAVCVALVQGTDLPLRKQVIYYSAGLFVACMVCHGELYRLKPHPRYLTSFYLMISAGGALGGFCVAVAAPLLLNSIIELHIGLWLCAALLSVMALREKSFPISVGVALGCFITPFLLPLLHLSWTDVPKWADYMMYFKKYAWGLAGVSGFALLCFVKWPEIIASKWSARNWTFTLLAAIGLGVALGMQAWKTGEKAILVTRNFYGVLTVFEYNKDNPDEHYYLLQHGRITHGLQFATPSQAMWHTSYYGDGSGVGIAYNANAADKSSMRVGLVGLGTGTFITYGRTNDYLRIYEIDPTVEHLARTRFTHLKYCPSKVDIALGDARLSMENEPKQDFDLIALDAFSSDAIPVHLLTREAVEIYLKHLKPDGVLAVHISNRYIDLQPVLNGLVRHFRLYQAVIEDDKEEDWWLYSSTWVLLSRDDALLKKTSILSATSYPEEKKPPLPLWTDDYASLFPILN